MNEITFTLLLILGAYAAFLTADYAQLRAKCTHQREIIDRLTQRLRIAREEIAVAKDHLSPSVQLLRDVLGKEVS